MKTEEKKDNKSSGMSNVLELLRKPEAMASPDYPKLALQATKREL